MKRISRILVLILSLSCFAFAQDAGKGKTNPRLLRELTKMMTEDQRYRTEVSRIEEQNLPGDEKEKRIAAAGRKQEIADQKNVRRLVSIIRRHGWPGRSEVGPEGAMAAFLVLQHASPA
ncbi:MAG: hypothetical protein ACKV2V_30135 [Blastocatellia bacterium]